MGVAAKRRKTAENPRTRAVDAVVSSHPPQCPYLDTIDLAALDFDFEKKCSSSLSPVHVYACLCCGKYFSGRGKSTRAYDHSLEESHHVFMRLADGSTWCLPDGYAVGENATLRRIRDVLRPAYDAKYVNECVDACAPMWRRGLDGVEFLVGVTGLNNVGGTSDAAATGANAVVQALNRVAPLRRAMLLLKDDEDGELPRCGPLTRAFSDLTKKIWNAKNFKGHSSPHEFSRAVRDAMKKRSVKSSDDALDFLRFFLNELKREEFANGASESASESLVGTFQGEVEVVSRDVANANAAPSSTTSKTSPFLMLSMDLPAAPLFQDVMEKKIIPQVSLERQLLKKFDGSKYRITKLPEHLIVTYSRFAKNNFFVEKNPTIVTFPVRGLNLADHIPVPANEPATYDLIANIVHDGTPDKGSYRAFVYHASDKNWYETQDLRVVEVLPQQVSLTETYVQIYQRRR